MGKKGAPFLQAGGKGGGTKKKKSVGTSRGYLSRFFRKPLGKNEGTTERSRESPEKRAVKVNSRPGREVGVKGKEDLL